MVDSHQPLTPLALMIRTQHSLVTQVKFIALFGLLLSAMTLTGCQFGSNDNAAEEIIDKEDSMEEMMNENEAENEAPAPTVKKVEPVIDDTASLPVDTSCAAQSCGEEGSEVTCLRANGCFCSDEGCVNCKTKNETCSVSADCCGGGGLECQSVTLTNGTTEKRCMQVIENICTVTCSEDGTWSPPRGCRNEGDREDVLSCDEYEGSCTPPIPGERNERRCSRS